MEIIEELVCERCKNNCKIGYLFSFGRVRLLYHTSAILTFLGLRGFPTFQCIVAIYCPFCHNVRLRYLDKNEMAIWDDLIKKQTY